MVNELIHNLQCLLSKVLSVYSRKILIWTSIGSLIIIIVISTCYIWPSLNRFRSLNQDIVKALVSRNEALVLSTLERSADEGQRIIRGAEISLDNLLRNIQKVGRTEAIGEPPPEEKDYKGSGKLIHTLGNHPDYETPVTFKYPQTIIKGNKDRAYLTSLWKEFYSIASLQYSQNPGIKWIYLGTSDGSFMVYPTSPAIPTNYDPRVRSWFKLAMENSKDTVWTKPYFTAGGNDLVFTVAKAIQRKTDNTYDVLGIDIPVGRIVERMLLLPHCENCSVALVKRSGEVLATKELNGRTGAWTEPPIEQSELSKLFDDSLDAAQVENIRKSISHYTQKRESGRYSGFVHAERIDVSSYMIYVVAIPNTDLFILGMVPKGNVGVDGNIIIGQLLRCGRALLLLSVLFCVLFIVIIAGTTTIGFKFFKIGLSKSLKNPLEQLTNLANEIDHIRTDYKASNDKIYFGASMTYEHSVITSSIHKLLNVIAGYQLELTHNVHFAAIGQSASMIAHDVRKPLTNLKSLIMLLPEKRDDREFIRDFSKKVEESIDKTNSMLNEILEFSKDATSLERRDSDPQSIITSSLSDVFTGKADISIEVSYDLKHKNYLNVDSNRVVRVITNILGNAVEAMDGVGRVWIRTEDMNSVIPAEAGIHLTSGDSCLRRNDSEERRNENAKMRIILGNDGPAIPEDVQKRLFDPFFTKGKKSGTGLGLAICQKVVEMHGGMIRVKSESSPSPLPSPPRGEGDFTSLPLSSPKMGEEALTEFIIELPATPANLTVNEAELIHHSDELKTFIEEEKEREQYGESENKAEFMRLHKEHGRAFYMLVVDDEPLFRETIRTILNQITQVCDHVKIIEADSAEMGLNLFGEHDFDYVIADIDMGRGRMNGYEFIKQVMKEHSGTKVLLHSNKRREDCDQEIREISSLNFMGFMPKPMKQSELLQFLARKSFEQKAEVKTETQSKKNVLVLNDDDALLMSFKILLRAPDVQVLEASNVSTALQHVAGNKIDLILSDINLGDTKVDGYDFLKEVRKRHKDLPFYMISGYSESEEWPKAQKEGATGYLQLPVDKEQLVALLN